MRIDYGKQNIFDSDIYFTANSLKKFSYPRKQCFII